MKRLLVVAVFLAILPITSFSQWIGLHSQVRMALNRIQQALNSGDISSIGDMFPAGVTMRIQDSLYTQIASMYAIEKINDFFANKDSLYFRFGLPGSGELMYTQNGKRDTVKVDIWLKRSISGPEIYAINISNYPLATVFFDIPRNQKDSKQ
jgi:hypothetical protein